MIFGEIWHHIGKSPIEIDTVNMQADTAQLNSILRRAFRFDQESGEVEYHDPDLTDQELVFVYEVVRPIRVDPGKVDSRIIRDKECEGREDATDILKKLKQYRNREEDLARIASQK